MFIAQPFEEINTKVCDMAKAIIEQFGKVQRVDVWGKKRLAYMVQDNVEGYYTLITFESTRQGIVELDRKLRMSEETLRHMIISKGE